MLETSSHYINNTFLAIYSQWMSISLCHDIIIFYTGILAAPNNITVQNGIRSITISWSAPFSLDVSEVDPDIWYTVLISNVTDEDNPTAVPCTDCHNLTQTHYIFSPDFPSPCHNYTFTVIPQNRVGNGTWSESIMGHHTKGDLCKTKSERCFVNIEVCFVCQHRRRRTPVVNIMLVKWNTKLLAERSFSALSCIITAFHKGCCYSWKY